MKIQVLQPHGFCAGVTNALRKARRLLAEADRREPVYCLHELVHNELVVAELRALGMIFVESPDEVPGGSTVLFSAHGVSPSVRLEATRRGLNTVDATCPFVARVHAAARSYAERGLPVVVIGNPHHAEVKGIVGEVEAVGGTARVVSGSDADDGFGALPVGVVSQTTMNADEVVSVTARLRERFPIETMAEVCNATKERQDAVKRFRGDALLVLGSANSSNTRRLCEVASCRTFRAGTLAEVKALDLSEVSMLGVTSGASTPEDFFQDAVSWLESH